MSRRALLTTILILTALAVAVWIFAYWRSDLREAWFEARHPAEGQMVEVDGREVHVVVRGDGPDLVLIHGAGGSHRDFTYDLVDRLSASYRIFAVDRPGFGWTERVHARLTGPLSTGSESPVEQARHLARAVRQLGAERPLVVGHSFGGAVAMGWALEEPAAGIVILSGATMPWPGEIDWTYRVLGSLPGGAVLPVLVSAFVPRAYVHDTLSAVFAPQQVPDDYLSRAGVMMATRVKTLRANARQVAALKPEVAAMSQRYGSIDLPVEILHGTADRTVYPDVHAEPLSKLVPDANLTLLEGVGHMPHHVVPEDVVAAIDRAARRAGLR